MIVSQVGYLIHMIEMPRNFSKGFFWTLFRGFFFRRVNLLLEFICFHVWQMLWSKFPVSWRHANSLIQSCVFFYIPTKQGLCKWKRPSNNQKELTAGLWCTQPKTLIRRVISNVHQSCHHSEIWYRKLSMCFVRTSKTWRHKCTRTISVSGSMARPAPSQQTLVKWEV
jgi:hypothetical protein